LVLDVVVTPWEVKLGDSTTNPTDLLSELPQIMYDLLFLDPED